MKNPKRVLFIRNPISGNKKNIDLESHVAKILKSKKFDWDIYKTTCRGDATERAKKAVDEAYSLVVAVGGDGTINEVAQGLLGTEVPMGIIPNGSGNGLARFLKIPNKPKKAIKRIKKGKKKRIDTGLLNGQLFLNIAGFGFDAQVAQAFDRFGKRGFVSYILLTVREYLKFRPSTYKIEIDRQKVERKAFLLSIANSSQFGNNAHIAPKAKINDGQLDLIVLKPFPFWYSFILGRLLFNKKIDQSKYFESFRGKNIIVETSDKCAHIDGEPIFCEKINHIQVQEGALRVVK